MRSWFGSSRVEGVYSLNRSSNLISPKSIWEVRNAKADINCVVHFMAAHLGGLALPTNQTSGQMKTSHSGKPRTHLSKCPLSAAYWILRRKLIARIRSRKFAAQTWREGCRVHRYEIRASDRVRRSQTSCWLAFRPRPCPCVGGERMCAWESESSSSVLTHFLWKNDWLCQEKAHSCTVTNSIRSSNIYNGQGISVLKLFNYDFHHWKSFFFSNCLVTWQAEFLSYYLHTQKDCL